MVNRILIRIKVLQIVYAYYQNGNGDLKSAENDLQFSLKKSYELYLSFLLLLIEVTHLQNQILETKKGKYIPTEEELNPNIIEAITRLSNIAKDDLNYLDMQTEVAYNSMCLEEKNLKKDVYNENAEAIIILDLKRFNAENVAIQKRIILYSINKIFGTTKGIEKIHIEDIIKLCNNNIGNKFLTPNKKTKIVIKNKKIIISDVK